MADITKTIEIKGVGFRDLRKQAKDLRDEMARVTDPEQAKELAEQYGEIRSRMDEVNHELKVMSSDNTLTRMKAELGGVGKALKDLDFNTANQRLQSMTKISFKSVTGSIKDMSKTFVNLGKTLIKNPIFLLVAVTTSIVFAIVKLQKEFGILDDYIKMVTKPLNILIDALKRLADIVGLTNFKEQELADDRARRAEEERQRVNNQLDWDDLEIDSKQALLRAHGIVRKEDLKQDLEYTRQKLINSRDRISQDIAESQARLNALNTKRKLNKEEIEEQKELNQKLEDLNKLVISASNKIAVHEIETKKKLTEFDKKQADEASRRSQESKKAKEKEVEERLKAEREYRKGEIDLMDEGIEKEIALLDFKYQVLVEDTQRRKDLNREEKDNLLAQQKEFYARDLEELQKKYDKQKDTDNWYYETFTSETQKAIDIANGLTEEGLKNLEAIREKELEDLKELGLTEEEENKRRLTIEAKFNADKEKLQAKHREAINAIAGIENGETEIAKIQREAEEELEVFRTLLENKQITQEEFDELELGALERKEAKVKELLYGEEDADPLEVARQEKEDELAILEEAYENELISFEEFLERKEALEEKYSNKVSEINRKEKEEIIKVWEARAKISKQVLGDIASLVTASYEHQINQAEGNEELQEKLREKQFKAEKSASIGMAVIDTALGITKAISSAPFPANLPAIALASITGASQIATISAQKYKSSGSIKKPRTSSSGGGGSLPSVGSETAPTTPTIPDIDFERYEREKDYNTDREPIIIENNVSISETEISDSQNRVLELENYTTL